MEKLWWNHITKAHKFIEDIVAAALEGTSIILSLPANVPWRNTLLELVESQLKLGNPKNSFEVLKCPEEEAGLFLLNKYCRKERRAAYRYGVTYAEFLGQCGDTVLNDRYVWVTDIPEAKYEEWLEFVITYQKSVTKKTPAVFILEINDMSFAKRAKKGIKKLIFDQNIGAYDKFAFSALAATENSCRDYMRPYLAELAATICSDDIELCAECVCMGNTFMKEPSNTISSMMKERCRSNGDAYQFSKTDDEIKRLVWETQLKSVFPVIEKFRGHFIEKYDSQIKKALPISNSYGENVTVPEDVEIGTLLYMAGCGAISVSSWEYEELQQYRNARNKLAHLDILDLDAVDSILKRVHSV